MRKHRFYHLRLMHDVVIFSMSNISLFFDDGGIGEGELLSLWASLALEAKAVFALGDASLLLHLTMTVLCTLVL
jgi:hypothetical protein